MFEEKLNFKVCGGAILNGSFTPLYCNSVTGEVVYEDDYSAMPMQIGEVSISAPLEIESLNAISSGLANGAFSGAIGLIYSRDAKVIAILDEETAEIRKLGSEHLPGGTPIPIDTNLEYESDDKD